MVHGSENTFAHNKNSVYSDVIDIKTTLRH